MAEPELYSIEAVIEALMRTSAACAHAADDHAVIRGTLLPLMELMQAKCGVFYPTGSLEVSAPIRVHSAATGEPHMPGQLPAEMGEFIFESLQQVATSQDPAFTRQHLKKMPVATAASSSIWAGVTAGEARFGILALFDPATRSFGSVEQKLVRTFSLQMGHGLASSRSRNRQAANAVAAAAAPAPAPEAGVVDRYLEFSRIMNGISRELINPLTAVLGYIELLKGEQQNERSLHYLQKLQEQLEKTQAVVSSLNAAPQAGSWRPAASGQPTSAIPTLVPKPVVVPNPTAEHHSRVLLIQKSEAVMEFQKSVLSTAGADAVCVSAGWEAVQLLQNTKVDGVILDDELEGEWNASRIFAWICEHKPELAQKVLLTVSPKPADDVREWMEGCGIPSVTKPLHIMKLFEGVQRMLGMTAPLPAPNSKFLH